MKSQESHLENSETGKYVNLIELIQQCSQISVTNIDNWSVKNNYVYLTATYLG
jgi:hypothetical protein